MDVDTFLGRQRRELMSSKTWSMAWYLCSAVDEGAAQAGLDAFGQNWGQRRRR
jgi:hypothetical protein